MCSCYHVLILPCLQLPAVNDAGRKLGAWTRPADDAKLFAASVDLELTAEEVWSALSVEKYSEWDGMWAEVAPFTAIDTSNELLYVPPRTSHQMLLPTHGLLACMTSVRV